MFVLTTSQTDAGNTSEHTGTDALVHATGGHCSGHVVRCISTVQFIAPFCASTSQVNMLFGALVQTGGTGFCPGHRPQERLQVTPCELHMFPCTTVLHTEWGKVSWHIAAHAGGGHRVGHIEACLALEQLSIFCC